MSAPPGKSAPMGGPRLGRYELLTRLGTGGMGEVWVARQKSLGGFERLVAVKRILPRFAADQSFVMRFANEARVAASLSHPNIVQIHDLEEDRGEVFISMELVRGETLQSVIRRAWELTGQPIATPLAAGIMARVCRALHHAHTHHDPVARVSGLVHRDVAPANVLIGFRGEVKVVDFGIARALTGLAPATGPLHGEGGSGGSGGSGGRVAYMSPEQSRGEELDARSDVFSAGIVLWELLTGMRLFGGMTSEETRQAVTTAEPVRTASSVRPGLDAELSAIASRALEKDRDVRFRTAGEMADSLEAHLLKSGIAFSEGPLVHLMERLFRDQKERWNALAVAAGSSGANPTTGPAPEPTAPVVGPPPSVTLQLDEELADTSEVDLFESTIQDDIPRFTDASLFASDSTDPDDVRPVLDLAAPATLSAEPVVVASAVSGPEPEPIQTPVTQVADGFEPSPFEDDEDTDTPIVPSFVRALEATLPAPPVLGDALAIEVLELAPDGAVLATEVIVRKKKSAAQIGHFEGPGVGARVDDREVVLSLPGHARSVSGGIAPRELRLAPGQTETILIDESVYRFRAFVPQLKLPRGVREVAWVVYLVAVVIVLGVHGLSAPVFAILEEAGIAATVAPVPESFAEGRMAPKKDAAKPKPPPKRVLPPKLEVKRDEPKRPATRPTPVVVASVEAAPQLPRSVREKVAEARRASSATSATNAAKRSVDELKTRLTTPTTGAATKLADVKTNIDAKGAGRVSDAHRVTGVVDSLPGVASPTFATDGGGPTGGPLAGEVANGVANKLANAAPPKTGNVRGKVTSMKSAAKVSGQLDPGQVYGVIDKSIGRIQACYEGRLRLDGGLAGRITFRWTVTMSGGVTGVQQTASTVSDPEVATCVKRVLEGLRFPKPEGGTVEISYPFIFRSS